MNEFTKITPVSIGLLVDEQQFLNGITGIRSFSMEYEYKDHSHFWAPFSSQFAELNRDFSSRPAPAMPAARASPTRPSEQKRPPKNPAGAQKRMNFCEVKRLLRHHRPGLGTAPHTGHSAGQRKLPGADERLVPSRTKGGRLSKLKHPGAKHVGGRPKAGECRRGAFGRTALQAKETLDTGSKNRRNGRDKEAPVATGVFSTSRAQH